MLQAIVTTFVGLRGRRQVKRTSTRDHVRGNAIAMIRMSRAAKGYPKFIRPINLEHWFLYRSELRARANEINELTRGTIEYVGDDWRVMVTRPEEIG